MCMNHVSVPESGLRLGIQWMALRRLVLLLAGMITAMSIAETFAQELSGTIAGSTQPSRLKASVTRVQPMTGIVLWSDHENAGTDAIALEYRYCGYDEVVNADGVYDWVLIDRLLDEIASRNHQAILRFHFIYPGRETTVPASIKKLGDYRETIGKSEGQTTHFCDWSHPALQQFSLDFYTKFAKRYDRDPRIAYLQTGFGLWAEYHIYDGPWELGKTFPDKAYQARFLNHLAGQFRSLPWSISVDSADFDYTPLEDNAELLKLGFGVFDDSFLCKQHKKENEVNWKTLSSHRWMRAPAGGEFSYYNKRDQRMALSPEGPNGETFESAAKRFHLSYIIGSDQPSYQTMDRIRQAGMSMGYRFRVTGAQISGGQLTLRVANDGIAPIYRDAYFAAGAGRSKQTLRGLRPGQAIDVQVPIADQAKFDPARLRIESDSILASQTIEFDADVNVQTR